MQSPDTERTRQDGYWTVLCADCNRTFDSKRSDAAFCSAGCRVRYSRRAEKFLRALDDLRGYGYGAKKLASQYPKSTKAFEAMQKLHQDISEALYLFEM